MHDTTSRSEFLLQKTQSLLNQEDAKKLFYLSSSLISYSPAIVHQGVLRNPETLLRTLKPDQLPPQPAYDNTIIYNSTSTYSLALKELPAGDDMYVFSSTLQLLLMQLTKAATMIQQSTLQTPGKLKRNLDNQDIKFTTYSLPRLLRFVDELLKMSPSNPHAIPIAVPFIAQLVTYIAGSLPAAKPPGKAFNKQNRRQQRGTYKNTAAGQSPAAKHTQANQKCLTPSQQAHSLQDASSIYNQYLAEILLNITPYVQYLPFLLIGHVQEQIMKRIFVLDDTTRRAFLIFIQTVIMQCKQGLLDSDLSANEVNSLFGELIKSYLPRKQLAWMVNLLANDQKHARVVAREVLDTQEDITDVVAHLMHVWNQKTADLQVNQLSDEQQRPVSVTASVVHSSYVEYLLLMSSKLLSSNEAAAQRCFVNAMQQLLVVEKDSPWLPHQCVFGYDAGAGDDELVWQKYDPVQVVTTTHAAAQLQNQDKVEVVFKLISDFIAHKADPFCAQTAQSQPRQQIPRQQIPYPQVPHSQGPITRRGSSTQQQQYTVQQRPKSPCPACDQPSTPLTQPCTPPRRDSRARSLSHVSTDSLGREPSRRATPKKRRATPALNSLAEALTEKNVFLGLFAGESTPKYAPYIMFQVLTWHPQSAARCTRILVKDILKQYHEHNVPRSLCQLRSFVSVVRLLASLCARLIAPIFASGDFVLHEVLCPLFSILHTHTDRYTHPDVRHTPFTHAKYYIVYEACLYLLTWFTPTSLHQHQLHMPSPGPPPNHPCPHVYDSLTTCKYLLTPGSAQLLDRFPNGLTPLIITYIGHIADLAARYHQPMCFVAPNILHKFTILVNQTQLSHLFNVKEQCIRTQAWAVKGCEVVTLPPLTTWATLNAAPHLDTTSLHTPHAPRQNPPAASQKPRQREPSLPTPRSQVGSGQQVDSGQQELPSDILVHALQFHVNTFYGCGNHNVKRAAYGLAHFKHVPTHVRYGTPLVYDIVLEGTNEVPPPQAQQAQQGPSHSHAQVQKGTAQPEEPQQAAGVPISRLVWLYDYSFPLDPYPLKVTAANLRVDYYYRLWRDVGDVLPCRAHRPGSTSRGLQFMPNAKPVGKKAAPPRPLLTTPSAPLDRSAYESADIMRGLYREQGGKARDRTQSRNSKQARAGKLTRGVSLPPTSASKPRANVQDLDDLTAKERRNLRKRLLADSIAAAQGQQGSIWLPFNQKATGQRGAVESANVKGSKLGTKGVSTTDTRGVDERQPALNGGVVQRDVTRRRKGKPDFDSIAAGQGQQGQQGQQGSQQARPNQQGQANQSGALNVIGTRFQWADKYSGSHAGGRRVQGRRVRQQKTVTTRGRGEGAGKGVPVNAAQNNEAKPQQQFFNGVFLGLWMKRDDLKGGAVSTMFNIKNRVEHTKSEHVPHQSLVGSWREDALLGENVDMVGWSSIGRRKRAWSPVKYGMYAWTSKKKLKRGMRSNRKASL